MSEEKRLKDPELAKLLSKAVKAREKKG